MSMKHEMHSKGKANIGGESSEENEWINLNLWNNQKIHPNPTLIYSFIQTVSIYYNAEKWEKIEWRKSTHFSMEISVNKVN